MISLVTLATILGVSLGLEWNKEFTTKEFKEANAKDLFKDWKKAFDKTYKTMELEAKHYKTFLKNCEFIGEVNSQDLTYKMRLNQFGDLTGDEFKIYVHGHKGSCLKPPQLEMEISSKKLPKGLNNPSSVDWQAKGDVTPVKNQGQCGSCWAFSTTGCIECNYKIQKGQLVSLSEQQLVDCSGSYGNYGCNGGWWYNAFDYVQHEGGLCSEQEYPYKARDGSCKASSCGKKYDPIQHGVKITPDNEADLETAVAKGCVSIGVEADQSSFQFYSSGVLTGTCGTRIDHGVLAVGYGTQGNQKYWKVKNSWGSSWGDKGYIYICRDCNKNGNEGECGIRMYPYLVAV